MLITFSPQTLCLPTKSFLCVFEILRTKFSMFYIFQRILQDLYVKSYLKRLYLPITWQEKQNQVENEHEVSTKPSHKWWIRLENDYYFLLSAASEVLFPCGFPWPHGRASAMEAFKTNIHLFWTSNCTCELAHPKMLSQVFENLDIYLTIKLLLNITFTLCNLF